MKRLITLLVATGLAFVGASGAASSLGDETIAIENARIVPVSGPAIEKGTVLIRAGKIAAIGASVDVPAGARRIDATGMSVYPGLIDSGTTVGLIEIGSIAASNDISELGDMNPQLYAYDAYNPNSELIPAARFGGVTTVVSSPQGGTIAGQPLLADLNGFTVEQVAVKRSLGFALSFPSGVGSQTFDFATFSVKRTSDADARKAQEKKLDELKTMLDDARAYQKARAARDQDPKLPVLTHDLKLDAIQPALAGELPVIVSASDFRDVKRAVAFCEEQKLKMVLVTNGTFDSTDLATAAAFLAQHHIPVVLGPMYQLPQHEDDRYDLPQEAPGILAKAGVRIAFATFDSADVRDLPYQAAMAVAYGTLSKEDALRALTVWPAEIWGVADRIGSLEVGKYANLIVTTGDPLEPRTDVKYVFIEGRPAPLKSRQSDLYDEYKDRIP
jgi:imidazolonepropionase-like amidohydrolase